MFSKEENAVNDILCAIFGVQPARVVVERKPVNRKPPAGPDSFFNNLIKELEKNEKMEAVKQKPCNCNRTASNVPAIDRVLFQDTATVVFWKDGTKTVVKTQNDETFDKEKGLAMAFVKKACGNTRDYYEMFLKYCK